MKGDVISKGTDRWSWMIVHVPLIFREQTVARTQTSVSVPPVREPVIRLRLWEKAISSPAVMVTDLVAHRPSERREPLLEALTIGRGPPILKRRREVERYDVGGVGGRGRVEVLGAWRGPPSPSRR